MKIILWDNSNSRFNIKVTDGKLEIEADGLMIDKDTDKELIEYYLEIQKLLKE